MADLSNEMNSLSVSIPPTIPSELEEQFTQFVTDVTKTKKRCKLEDFTQFSKCHLWKLMMSFYDRKGPESWAKGIVPHFITSNTFIGRQYAKVWLNKIHQYICLQILCNTIQYVSV